MDPLTAGLNFISQIVDKIFPDKDKADAAKLEMFKLQQQGAMQEVMNEFNLALQNIAVNLEDAKSDKWYKQWRPFVGWVCGIALAYNYVAMPFIVWAAKLIWGAQAPEMPILESGELMTLLFGMLGIGGMKTIERVNGIKK
jgi:hypothetical protein